MGYKALIALVLFVALYSFSSTVVYADNPPSGCSNQTLRWVSDGYLVVFNGDKSERYLVKAGLNLCLPETTTRLYISSDQWAEIKKVVVFRYSGCNSGYAVSWPWGGYVHFISKRDAAYVTPGYLACVYERQSIELQPGSMWAELGPIEFTNPAPPVIAVSNPSVPPAANSSPSSVGKEAMMKKFGIRKEGERYVIPAITDHSISLTERLLVIEMVAENWGIPSSLLKAICYQEGWDRYTGRRCENWYSSGKVITSADGNGLCAFQITLRWHPESNAELLRTDFHYCVEEASRILVGRAVRPSNTNPYAWEPNVRQYGDGNNGTYWSKVRGFLDHIPTNPETGKPAW